MYIIPGLFSDDFIRARLAVYEEEIKLIESRAKMAEKVEVPKEMYDFIKVMEMGAKKHGMNNWLNPDGKKSSEKDMHDSLFHHLAESFCRGKDKLQDSNTLLVDAESGLDPLLHLACRALMLYTRRQRGIVHKDDK